MRSTRIAGESIVGAFIRLAALTLSHPAFCEVGTRLTLEPILDAHRGADGVMMDAFGGESKIHSLVGYDPASGTCSTSGDSGDGPPAITVV